MATKHDSFLRKAQLMWYFTRLWGYGRYSIPQKRIKLDKWQLKLSDIIFLIIEIGSTVALFIGQIIFRPTTRATVGTNATVVERVLQLLNLLAVLGYLLNLYLEVRCKSRFFSLIFGLHDFDVVVWTKYLN